MARIAMIYDADGGLLGELRYLINHAFGDAECALCTITHGSLRRKPEFAHLLERLAADGHTVEVIHRNQQNGSQDSASGGRLPCVIIESATTSYALGRDWKVLITRQQIEACAGDVAAFGALLTEALSA